MGQPGEVEVEHCRPLPGREYGDQVPGLSAQLRWTGASLDETVEHVSVVYRLQRPSIASSPSHELMTDVQSNDDEPRPEALWLLQPIQAEHGLEGRVLRRILGQYRILERTAAETEQDRIVVTDEFRERSLVAVPGDLDEVGIACLLIDIRCWWLVETGKIGCVTASATWS